MGLGDGVWIIYMFLTDLIFNRQGALCWDAVAGNVRRCCAKSTDGVCNHLFPFQPSSLALMGVVRLSLGWGILQCWALSPKARNEGKITCAEAHMDMAQDEWSQRGGFKTGQSSEPPSLSLHIRKYSRLFQFLRVFPEEAVPLKGSISMS